MRFSQARKDRLARDKARWGNNPPGQRYSSDPIGWYDKLVDGVQATLLYVVLALLVVAVAGTCGAVINAACRGCLDAEQPEISGT